MRDRLVELLQNFADGTVTGNGTIVDRTKVEDVADFLLANGVIVPPCKVGQIVYVVRSQTSNGKNLYLRQERIDHYRIFNDRSFMCFESNRISVSSDAWSTTVFLTKEEAEKALKGGAG